MVTNCNVQYFSKQWNKYQWIVRLFVFSSHIGAFLKLRSYENISFWAIIPPRDPWRGKKILKQKDHSSCHNGYTSSKSLYNVRITTCFRSFGPQVNWGGSPKCLAPRVLSISHICSPPLDSHQKFWKEQSQEIYKETFTGYIN